jgi:hypothetical protein
MEDLHALAEQLAYVVATSDLLPDLGADIDAPVETEGDAVSFRASTASGAIRIVLIPDPM